MTHPRLAAGLRRLPATALAPRARAERFEGLTGRTPGQCLAAFKRASAPLGLSATARDLVDQLMAFSQPQDWREGARPIVWPSNETLAHALALSERSVRRLLAQLIAAGIVVAVDSPQGRRWGRRDAQGRIREAFGFDLSPLAQRFEEFLAIAEASRAERARQALWRRRLTIASKAIRQIAETALELGLTDRDWRAWLQQALASAGGASMRLEAAVRALEEERRQGEALLREALERPVEKDLRESGRPDMDDRLITTTTERESGFGKEDRQGIGNGPSAGASPTGAGQEEDDPDDEEEPPAFTPAFVLRIAPPLKRWLPSARPTWGEVVEAADRLRRELGVSQNAWAEACQVLGRYGAATAIAVIAAKRAEISAPGGYLRGMVARARKGELYLVRSLHGLAGRARGVA